mmetsp:Transcript_79351/g.190468  ORF Transcript_79351/g.190468 Transcript_79351/m.190468 type:complete len:492 (-) Transcript_79351:72-1547(-)
MGAALPGCHTCRPGPENSNKSLRPFLQALKEAGGVEKTPDAEGNKRFLELLNHSFPELAIYRQGRIQVSPGVEEIGNSPTEYYRTVGAIIALLACYSSSLNEEFGLECVSAGKRGPMSLDQAPGKFLNMGNRPVDYYQFCERFARQMESEADWWGMMIFLVIHDVGKSDEFRKAVNETLPPNQRTDDHDKALASALKSDALKRRLLPSVAELSPARQASITAGFSTNFQLPQLGQGEIACINFRGLLELDRKYLLNGSLDYYFYHSIFDIAGASCNEKYIFPLALVPVYMGFTQAMDNLIARLIEQPKTDERTLYFNFLYTNFQRSYSQYDQEFSTLCESRVFCHETGLATLRVLAMTRNSYKNPAKVTELLLGDMQLLVQELAGSPVGPQIMLYYGPDLLRMSLGEDLTDPSGQNMMHALEALGCLYRKARKTLALATSGDYQYQLNVAPLVTVIRKAKDWKGGKQLREVVSGVRIKNNDLHTEGIVELP